MTDSITPNPNTALETARTLQLESRRLREEQRALRNTLRTTVLLMKSLRMETGMINGDRRRRSLTSSPAVNDDSPETGPEQREE
jgi:hypothetical protein